MIDLIKKIIGNKEADKEKKAETGEINLATCALLLELANVDGEFSKQEKDNIIDIFKKKYSLPEGEVNELIQSSEAELEKSIDLWKYTNLINQSYSLEENVHFIIFDSYIILN